MGNRSKSTHLKILENNPGRRPINFDEPKPERRIPIMPKWLKGFPAAAREWKREAKLLDEMGAMTPAEAGALAMRAYLGCQIQELAVEIQVEGRVIDIFQINKDGQEFLVGSKANPKCIQLKNLITEHRHHGSILGLDAPSRTKIKITKTKPRGKSDAFRARKRG